MYLCALRGHRVVAEYEADGDGGDYGRADPASGTLSEAPSPSGPGRAGPV